MFKTLRNNKGATLVIYAVMIVVLLGMTAVAVDTGSVMVEQARLQKAVDAVALAAAYDLPNKPHATATANRYIELNGFSPADMTVAFDNSDRTIIINANKRVPYTFARILGLSSTNVSSSAKAQCINLGQAFDYVIFSGSETADLAINGNQYDIVGSTHTNSNFSARGNSIKISGACEAMGTVTLNSDNIEVGLNAPNSPYISMPDFSETIRLQAEAAGTYYNGNKTFYGSSIDASKPIYVDGNVTINGSGFMGVGCILATGTITFNGSSQYVSTSDAVAIYSLNGDIVLNGANAVVEGILYAPNGTIKVNGSHQTVNGRLIANMVEMDGSDYTITVKGDVDDLKALPPISVKLVN